MKKSRLLFLSAIILAVFAWMFPTMLVPASAASIAAMSVPSVLLALIAIVAVTAAIAAAYHPSLFSWRMCTGTPFDDDEAEHRTGWRS